MYNNAVVPYTAGLTKMWSKNPWLTKSTSMSLKNQFLYSIFKYHRSGKNVSNAVFNVWMDTEPPAIAPTVLDSTCHMLTLPSKLVPMPVMAGILLC